MTFYILVGIMETEKDLKFFNEDGITLVYWSEEELKADFPDSEYVIYRVDDEIETLKANTETELKA